ncbi:unnamed protein product [Rotaria magnacalcarata]
MATADPDENQKNVRIIQSTDDLDFDDFTLVWLDAQLDSNEDCLETKKRLREILNTLYTFTDVEACRAFLVNGNSDNNHFCVIVSGTFSLDLLVPTVVDLSSVIIVTIYCFNSSKHMDIIDQTLEKSIHHKFLGVFTGLEELLTTLNGRISLLRTSLSIGKSSMFSKSNSSMKDLSQENAIFLWFHLLMYALFHLPRSNMTSIPMVEFCLAYYHDNDARLKEVEEFRKTYRPDQALKWYTRDSFVYRIVNRALRTQNIDTIFVFASFIGDLHDQLRSLHQEFLDYGAAPLLTVYRGQQMQIDEVRKIVSNIGGLVSMNTFFSTSCDRALSRILAQAGPGLASVLYEITIDTNVSAAPFSSVNDHTNFQGELEILFSVDAIFRVESATEETDEHGQVWLIKLCLVDERTEQKLTNLIDHFKRKRIGENSTILTISSLLEYMGDVKGANRFLLLLHKVLPENDPLQAIVYGQIGSLNIYDKTFPSELFFEDALNIYDSAESLLPNRDMLMATTLTNIAFLAMCNGDYEKAGESIVRAIELQRNYLLIDKENAYEYTLTSFINASAILFKLGDASRALKQYEIVLSLCNSFLPPTHPILTVVHEHLGVVHSHIGNSSEAIQHHEQSHKLRMQIYPDGHQELARSHANLGWRYVDSCNYDAARQQFECALSMHGKFQAWTNSSALANTLSGLATVSRRQGKLDDALNYLKQASSMISSKEHPDVDQIDLQMGRLLIDMNRHIEAEEVLKRVRDKSIKLDNKLDVAEIQLVFGQLYCRMKKPDQALQCFDRALEIRQEVTPTALPAIAKILHEMAAVYFDQQQYQMALDHLRQCLAFELKSLPKTHIDIAQSHNSIASVLWYLKDYVQASQEAQFAVQIALHSLEASDPLVIKFKQLLTSISHCLESENEKKMDENKSMPLN